MVPTATCRATNSQRNATLGGNQALVSRKALSELAFAPTASRLCGSLAKSRRPSSSQSRAPLCHASRQEDELDLDRLGGLGAADERDRLTGGRVDQDIALGVARAWPHDQLAEDARREAASAAIRPRRQSGQAARSRV